MHHHQNSEKLFSETLHLVSYIAISILANNLLKYQGWI